MQPRLINQQVLSLLTIKGRSLYMTYEVVQNVLEKLTFHCTTRLVKWLKSGLSLVYLVFWTTSYVIRNNIRACTLYSLMYRLLPFIVKRLSTCWLINLGCTVNILNNITCGLRLLSWTAVDISMVVMEGIHVRTFWTDFIWIRNNIRSAHSIVVYRLLPFIVKTQQTINLGCTVPCGLK